MSRSQYSWNSMYNQIMLLKDLYASKFYAPIHTVPFSNALKALDDSFLLANTTFSELKSNDYSLLLIKYSLHSNCEDLYLNNDSILREGRSLVLDLISEDIVLCPFRKFFNLNEVPETSIKYVSYLLNQPHKIEISNKLDGSMQSIRYWHDQFIQSGSSALDESKSPQLLRGKELLRQNINLQLLIKEHPDYTFIVEAILDDDPHVVSYAKTQLHLIGMRNIYTGEELTYKQVIDFAQKYQVATTYLEKISFNDVLHKKTLYPASQKEGWVIRIYTKDHNIRFKLKCDDYLKVHALYDVVSSPNAIIKCLVDNTLDDCIANLDTESRERVQRIARYIRKIISFKEWMIQKYYAPIETIEADKDFAIQVNKTVPKCIRHFIFNLRKNIKYSLWRARPNILTSALIKFTDLIDFVNKNKADWKQFNNANSNSSK